jgi:hypothetical protein
MVNWKLIEKILVPGTPNFPGIRSASNEELLPEAGTMGTLYIGRQGTGKTTSLARHLVEKFEAYPDQAIFVLDWSGSISDAILTLISQRPKEVRDKLLRRLVYDEMGHPEWVIPLPEFSNFYGSSTEDQVQRLANNLAKLAPELIKDAPFLAGLGIREIAPQLFRLCTAIGNEYGETWQATEAKRLLKDLPLLKKAISTYGFKVPEAKWYFENAFIPLRESERELRTYALLSLLGAIETPNTKARVGYYRPGWTPREAIKNGLMVIINGARLINQKNTQHYLFTQAYSLIMSEINTRVPGDPKDKPVALVMDEVYSLLSIPGMAEEVGQLSPLYRSRKLQPYIVLQALSQLAPTLREQIWSIGNIVCFAVSNFEEAYELAQQIFVYQPKEVKLGPKTETQQPIIEPDRGQYLQIANDLQRLKHRECILRRYTSEKVLDRHVIWVEKTKDVPAGEANLDELKERLLKDRGVRVRDALEVISQRKLTSEQATRPSI